MTKSVSKIVNLGFDKRDLNRVEIRCAVDNGPSRAIAERLGFAQDGICVRLNEYMTIL
jgi:ribosomal-protein-serine acetyltransferase